LDPGSALNEAIAGKGIERAYVLMANPEEFAYEWIPFLLPG
jgi:hypothetical protein